jgi:hypothetical protein
MILRRVLTQNRMCLKSLIYACAAVWRTNRPLGQATIGCTRCWGQRTSEKGPGGRFVHPAV